MTPATATVETTHSAVRELEDFRGRVSGTVITPEHETYDEARATKNLTYDRKPGAIVRVASESDVVESVKYALATGLEIAVRSGGHSIAGHSVIDGSLVIDFSEYRAVHVDPETRTARIQTGATSADIAGPAHAYGLALSTGDAATVAVGGLASGGGIGYMVRKYGLAVDNMLSVRMVTADAEVVTASKTENPDLFWAVRGGGGNFGIITEFEFQLAPVGAVLGREIFLPATREILRSYLDYALNAPDELTTIAHLLHAPPFPFMPEDRVGELMLSISVCYTGDLGEGERVVAPLRALAEPIVDTITAIPYPLVFEFMEPATHPHFAEVKMSFANELSDEALDGMIAAAGAATSPFSMVQMRPLGGAMARVPAGDTAFAHRDKNYFLAALSLWMEPSEEEPAHRQWARDLWQSWQPFANGAYVNFLGDEGEARVRDAYPQGTHDRLTAVKNRWDPENRFHNNQNVRPRR